ncbi:hypothetical protein [Novosphingobium sp. Rr 2-17]|uniref:hypothetical protein n=1 Tax=Novosphingobium sp. Rr 2-17 TaxID=555793 RepID=UPI0002F75CFB|nr:hypothetical protein [Novosphingobium sp. Rr 2-17]
MLRTTTLGLIAISASGLAGCEGTHVARDAGAAALKTPTGGAAVPVIGSGRYAYRFVLIDPHTGTPWPNHPYALTTTKHTHVRIPFVADEKNVYQGISDAMGSTVLFLMPYRLPDKAWDIGEQMGSGLNGETFRLTSPSGKPMANFPYLLVICTKPLQYHYGYSYPNGDTAYAASEHAAAVELYALISSDDDGDLPKSCEVDPPNGTR